MTLFISLKSRSNDSYMYAPIYMSSMSYSFVTVRFQRSVVCKLSICRSKGYVEDQRILLHMMATGHIMFVSSFSFVAELAFQIPATCHAMPSWELFVQGIDFW
jgi:hypothetical protein